MRGPALCLKRPPYHLATGKFFSQKSLDPSQLNITTVEHLKFLSVLSSDDQLLLRLRFQRCWHLGRIHLPLIGTKPMVACTLTRVRILMVTALLVPCCSFHSSACTRFWAFRHLLPNWPPFHLSKTLTHVGEKPWNASSQFFQFISGAWRPRKLELLSPCGWLGYVSRQTQRKEKMNGCWMVVDRFHFHLDVTLIWSLNEHRNKVQLQSVSFQWSLKCYHPNPDTQDASAPIFLRPRCGGSIFR